MGFMGIVCVKLLKNMIKWDRNDMKIYKRTDDLWAEWGFEGENSPVISVVGAGGKTSLIRALSAGLNDRKIRHIIMTTTHMWPMDFGPYGFQAGPIGTDGKVGSPEEDEIQMILQRKVPVLIESDGSKGLPCKAPEAWEPALLRVTTHVFGVLGASCLGKPVGEICHRPDKVADILESGCDHLLTGEDLALLASDRRGLRKNVDISWNYRVILNQVDDTEILAQAASVEKILGEKGIRAYLTSLK